MNTTKTLVNNRRYKVCVKFKEEPPYTLEEAHSLELAKSIAEEYKNSDGFKSNPDVEYITYYEVLP